MEYNNFNVNLDLYNNEESIKEQEFVAERMRKIRQRREREKKMRRRRKIFITSISTALILLIFLIVMLFKACSSDKTDLKTTTSTELQGEWAIDNVTKYIFNSDGSGYLQLPNDVYYFTFEIKDNIISIDFESNLVIDSSYTYIIEGKELSIVDVNNSDVEYTMKKQ